MKFLLLFFIFILFFINLTIIFYIDIYRKDKRNNVHFSVKIYKLNVININFSFSNIYVDNNDNIYIKIKENKNISLNYMIYIIKKITNKKYYYLLLKNISKNIVIKNLTLNTQVGYKDAHICAIFYGILHILKSNLIGYMNSKFYIINYKYFVNTIYNRNIFEFDYNFVIKIKVIYIINSILISLFKLKDGE